MRIVPIPCLSDNYAYLVVCEATGRAAVVDPSEAEPVAAAIAAEGVDLAAIWNTHHHWDHTGGNDALAAAYPQLEIVGHTTDAARIPGITRRVDEGDTVAVGDEVRARILFNPGHTRGAISYFIETLPAVFTGDTLFLAGCGRLFEGTPEMMYTSLSKLAALPDDTRVYCGHEYTASNLAFAAAVEPDNADVARRRAALAVPSIPGTIAEERATNPFLRARVPAVAAAAARRAPIDRTDPVAVFAALRQWKDEFRGVDCE
ncbi:MAG: hydroxyacylglutathione hydrolase [Deltaproteobacteria bacterium]|nr:MAG: hydroxyacylglutathione hydrolase [Deltaproteobacteria bacterium]